MILVLLGINHKTAPVELREKLACLAPDSAKAYQRLRQIPEIQEVLFYATCNRVEVIFASSEPETAIPKVMDFFLSQPELAAA